MHREPSAVLLSLSGFIALAVAMGIGRFAFTPMLPMMQADAGLGLAQGGWLASANYLGYLAGALTAAALPLNPATLLRLGLLLVVLTTALMGLSDGWTSWLVWRFIAGLASAWVLVGTATLCLARLATLGQAKRASLVFAGVGSGIALAGVSCMALSLAGVSSSTSWILLGGVSLVGMACASPLWRNAALPTTHAQAPKNVAAQKTRHFRLIFCYGILGFGYILPATFLPAQARLLVADPAIFGLAWPVFGLAAALSTLLAGRLLVRYSRRHSWAGAQLIMAAGVLLPALWPSVYAIVIAALCVGGTFMVITMLGMQEAQDRGGNNARGLIAAITAAFAAGQLAGPLVFSLTNTLFNTSLDFALILAAAALVAGSIWLLAPGPRLEPSRRDS